MSIQTRLKLARYGPMNYMMPIKDEVDRVIPKVDHNFTRHLDLNQLSQKILQIFSNPPLKDKYTKIHLIVINDFKKQPNNKKALIKNVHQNLIRKLVYFYENPQYYNHNFEHFCINWIVGCIFQMRKTIIDNMYQTGDIPYTNPNHPSSNGRYKFYKPMLNKCTIVMAHKIHDLLQPSLDRYKKIM